MSIKNNSVLLLSFLVLTQFSFAVSASNNSMANNNLLISIPHLTPGYEAGVGAVYLKPGASNLNYVINNKELPVQSPSWTEQELNPSYSAGFDLALAFTVPDSGNDVRFDWTHLYTKDSKSIQAAGVNFFVGPDYQIGPDGLSIRSATGSVNFRYDILNLDAGQYIGFGQFSDIRFFGGLSGGSLKESISSAYTGALQVGPFAGPFSTAQRITSSFYGVGPRFGMQMDYKPIPMFTLFGEGALSTLIGSEDAKTTYDSSATEVLLLFGQTNNSQFIKDNRLYHVVPGIDAKLGVKYEQCFNQVGTISVTAGYQAAVYIDAISQYTPSTLAQSLTTGGIFVDTMSHRLSNYSVQGPYINVALKF